MHIRFTYPIWAALIVGLVCLGLVLARLLAWVSARRELHRLNQRHTVIAEYDAPSQLTPAELGYIIDATFGMNELLATIAQLSMKGLVRLTPKGNDFAIVATDNNAKVRVDDSEASVLGYLRSLPDAKALWSQLSSAVSDVAGPQADFEDATLQSLVGKGLLRQNALTTVLFRQRVMAYLVATIGCLAALAPVYEWGRSALGSTGLGSGYSGIDRGVAVLMFVPLAVVVWVALFMYANILAYVYVHRDGVPMGATDALRALWPDVAGFRLFLQETEYVRLQHDRNSRDPAMAYCLALGLDPGFIRSLKS